MCGVVYGWDVWGSEDDWWVEEVYTDMSADLFRGDFE